MNFQVQLLFFLWLWKWWPYIENIMSKILWKLERLIILKITLLCQAKFAILIDFCKLKTEADICNTSSYRSNTDVILELHHLKSDFDLSNFVKKCTNYAECGVFLQPYCVYIHMRCVVGRAAMECFRLSFLWTKYLVSIRSPRCWRLALHER